MLIALGSMNRIKYLAVRLACERIGISAKIIMADVPSGVEVQPLGDLETILGATNRANAAQMMFQGAVGIGIENGVVQIDRNGHDEWYDRAWVAVRLRHGGTFNAPSAPVQLPPAAVQEAQRRGFDTTTVGEVIAEQNPGAQADDPHSFLTGGKFTRLQQLTDTVVTALEAAFLKEPRLCEPTPINALQFTIGGVNLPMPIREVAPGVRVALCDILGDWEFVKAAGAALAAKLVAADSVVLAMPDGKAQALLHELGWHTNAMTVVARKTVKPYMTGVQSVDVTSITTGKPQQLHFDEKAAQRVRGQSVIVVDDVVSTGASLDAMQRLIEMCGGRYAGAIAILTEGEPRKDVISLAHIPLF